MQTRKGLFGALIILLLLRPAWAAGPLLVNGAGQPLVWDLSGGPVPFNPDQGTLGLLDNAAATGLVAGNYATWEAVPTSNIVFTNAGSLPVDVDATNIFTFLGVCEGLSPVIYDTDGSITAAVFGSGSENFILGFAGIDCGTFVPPVITESVVVMNGRWIDGIDLPDNRELPVGDFTAVFLHEFGHGFNLDHTQINLAQAFDGDPSNDAGVPTMFPSLVNGPEQSTLHKDDIASASTLYPEANFLSTTATITGTIFGIDGVTPFQGANVIAHNIANPLEDAASNVSGARFFPSNEGGPPPANLEGLYEINNLTPGASYTIEIERVNPAFTGGSGVGPLDPPRFLPGPPEFWNGADESNTNPPDDPAAPGTPILVTAGTPVTDINVLINHVPDPNEPNNDTGTATPASCPSTLSFELDPAGDLDFYTFTAPAGTLFTGEVVAFRIGSFDSILGLFDGNGTLLFGNDDFFGLDSFISATLPPSPNDTYFVAVTGFPDFGFTGGHGQAGPYELHLGCEAPPPPIPLGTDPRKVLYVGDVSFSGVKALADTDGDGVADTQNFFGSGGGILSPVELDFDLNGRLFASEGFSPQVSIMPDADHNFFADTVNGFLSPLADGDGLRLQPGTGVVFLGDAFGSGDIATVRDTDDDGLPETTTTFATQMSSGISLDFSPSGRLYVVDVFGGAILTCSDANNDLLADADPCPTFSTAIPGAVAIRVDAAGRVFVVDAFNFSIVVLQDANGDGVADGPPSTFATLPPNFFFPFAQTNGITFGPDGKLYVLAFDFSVFTFSVLVFEDANQDLVADAPPTVFASGVSPLAAGLAFVADTTPPDIAFTSPANQAKVAFSPAGVTLQVTEDRASSTTVEVGGVPLAGSPFALQPGGGTLQLSVPVGIGLNTIVAHTTDPTGNSSQAMLVVELDPTIVMNSTANVGPVTLPASANAGGTNVPLIQFQVAAVGDDLNLNSVNLSLTGSVQPASLGTVTLWVDANANGVVNTGETSVATGTFSSSGQLTLQGAPLTVVPASSTVTFLITVNIPQSVQVTATTAAASWPQAPLSYPLGTWVAFGVLVALGLVRLRARYARMNPLTAGACALLLMVAAVGLSGCPGTQELIQTPPPQTGTMSASLSAGSISAVGVNSNTNVSLPAATINGPTITVTK